MAAEPGPPTVALKRLISKQVSETSAFFEVVYAEGGTVPLPLRGQYTAKSYADKAIEGFLLAQNRKQSNGQ